MKKYNKLMMLASFMFMTFSGTVFGGTFNTDSLDFNTLSVKKADGGNAGWSNSLNNIKSGDKISFNIYYHALGEVTANNVVTNLTNINNQIYAAGETVFVTGGVDGDNMEKAIGSTTISFSENSKLELFDTSWQPNQCGSTQCSEQLLERQDLEQVLTTEGLNIGNITGNNWENQGSVVVTFNVVADENTIINTENISGQTASIFNADSTQKVSWAQWLIIAIATILLLISTVKHIRHKQA